MVMFLLVYSFYVLLYGFSDTMHANPSAGEWTIDANHRRFAEAVARWEFLLEKSTCLVSFGVLLSNSLQRVFRPVQAGEVGMGVSRRHTNRRTLVEADAKTIQKSCSERGLAHSEASGGEAKGRARAGRAEAGKNNRTATPADSLKRRGEHHVRTLYGEGTARDLLRAV